MDGGVEQRKTLMHTVLQRETECETRLVLEGAVGGAAVTRVWFRVLVLCSGKIKAAVWQLNGT